MFHLVVYWTQKAQNDFIFLCSIVLPPAGHSINHQYHCCQLTRQSSCCSNFYRTFKIFIWLSLMCVCVCVCVCVYIYRERERERERECCAFVDLDHKPKKHILHFYPEVAEIVNELVLNYYILHRNCFCSENVNNFAVFYLMQIVKFRSQLHILAWKMN